MPAAIAEVHLLHRKGRLLCISADVFAARAEEILAFVDNGHFKAS